MAAASNRYVHNWKWKYGFESHLARQFLFPLTIPYGLLHWRPYDYIYIGVLRIGNLWVLVIVFIIEHRVHCLSWKRKSMVSNRCCDCSYGYLLEATCCPWINVAKHWTWDIDLCCGGGGLVNLSLVPVCQIQGWRVSQNLWYKFDGKSAKFFEKRHQCIRKQISYHWLDCLLAVELGVEYHRRLL